jgi:FtsP/CotA-like multicopper oxidase with cupredoxin domain
MKIITENWLRSFTITFFTAILFVFTFSFFVPDKQIYAPEIAGNAYNPIVISCATEILRNSSDDPLGEVAINDNRKPAGEFRNGIYYIKLEARMGYWYPETHAGNPILIKAFAEMGKQLQVPGPLIRVPEGTEIRATVRNSIKGPLVLYGFISRPGKFRDSIIINEGETKEIAFNAGSAGTFLYAVRDTTEKHIPSAITAPFMNSQLYGAFIIDPANQKNDPKERIFMIGMCGVNRDSNTTMAEYVINGLSWPYTERLNYKQGDTVHWRVINTSVLIHPMHLHGFPFIVNSFGTAGKDSIVPKEKERLVVTQFITTINNAIRMTWVPEREGNWLFHCHLADHIMPESFLRTQPVDHVAMNLQTHAHEGMGGLIMGIRIVPDKKFVKKTPPKAAVEKELTLEVGEQLQNAFHNPNGKGFRLIEKGIPVSKQFRIPGPPIILTRDQRVAIKIINTLKEPTTIHWHGLEIESYYDGVAGWGNEGKSLSPLIQPGDSFTVHITPPRAGTFMYHTHMHDKQLLDGLYGALIVLNPGETYDPERDKILLVSQGGTNPILPKDWSQGFGDVHYLLNGSNNPETMYFKKDVSYRLRVINISAQLPDYFVSQQSGFFISLKYDDKPVKWKLIAIDGMDLPARLFEIKEADRQRAGHGSTIDFEFTPHQPGDYHFEVKIAKALQVAQMIKVKE